jgi:hypothetical protein
VVGLVEAAAFARAAACATDDAFEGIGGCDAPGAYGFSTRRATGVLAGSSSVGGAEWCTSVSGTSETDSYPSCGEPEEASDSSCTAPFGVECTGGGWLHALSPSSQTPAPPSGSNSSCTEIAWRLGDSSGRTSFLSGDATLGGAPRGV